MTIKFSSNVPRKSGEEDGKMKRLHTPTDAKTSFTHISLFNGGSEINNFYYFLSVLPIIYPFDKLIFCLCKYSMGLSRGFVFDFVFPISIIVLNNKCTRSHSFAVLESIYKIFSALLFNGARCPPRFKCHKWSRICSACRKQFSVTSSLMTYHPCL